MAAPAVLRLWPLLLVLLLAAGAGGEAEARAEAEAGVFQPASVLTQFQFGVSGARREGDGRAAAAGAGGVTGARGGGAGAEPGPGVEAQHYHGGAGSGVEAGAGGEGQREAGARGEGAEPGPGVEIQSHNEGEKPGVGAGGEGAEPGPGVEAQPHCEGAEAQPRRGGAEPRPGVEVQREGAEPGPGVEAQPGVVEPGPGVEAQPHCEGAEAQPRRGGAEPGPRVAEPGPGVEAQPGPGVEAQPGPGVEAQPGVAEPGVGAGAHRGGAEPGPGVEAQPGVAEPGPGVEAQPGGAEPGPGVEAQPGVAEPGPGVEAQPGVAEPGPGVGAGAHRGVAEPGPGVEAQPGVAEPGPVVPPVPEEEPPLLVWWSGQLFPHLPRRTQRIECGAGPCVSSRRRRHRGRATAIIVYGTELRAYEAPLPRAARQAWALFHEESPMNNYLLAHAAAIRLFNYTATFRRHSDYPLSLQWLPGLPYLRRPPPLSLGRKQQARSRGLAPVLYLQSHCQVAADRDRYVRQLMQHLQIDSYGQCLQNKELPTERLVDTLTATTEDPEFMDFISKYKFHLAMENAICDDYMTEKLWRPMHLGVVPIYRGSPVVQDWLPNSRSVILIDDFKSPKDLADYINYLDQNDEEYMKYLEYKKPGGITNTLLVESLEKREWGVNDFNKPNYLNGFECYVCDQENKRLRAEKAHQEQPDKFPPPAPKMAAYNHLGCPVPEPGFGSFDDIPDNDSWKQMWQQDYWQSADQAEALATMILRNESDASKLWDYVHQLMMKRSKH